MSVCIAGTRLFLDHLINKEAINQENIDGYKREAITHMAVAAAVHGKSADVGMGISAAALALDLDFIPLGEEEYDFAVYKEYLNLKEMDVFIDTLKSSEFADKLAELNIYKKAYTWKNIGQIVYI